LYPTRAPSGKRRAATAHIFHSERAAGEWEVVYYQRWRLKPRLRATPQSPPARARHIHYLIQ
jgi:hypothetical protein